MAAPDLFSQEPIYHSETVNAAVEDPFEALADDPSGPPAEPAPYNPNQARGKFKQSDHNARTLKLLEDDGWFACRADQQRTTWAGVTYKLDFLGLFDYLAFKDGRFKGVQICAASDIGPHASKMWSADKTTFNNSAKCENLRRWIESGGEVEIIGWAKERVGNRDLWKPSVRVLTMKDVQAAIERRDRRGMPQVRASKGVSRRRR